MGISGLWGAVPWLWLLEKGNVAAAADIVGCDIVGMSLQWMSLQSVAQLDQADLDGCLCADCAVLCCAMLFCAIFFCSMLCFSVLCCVFLFCAVPCCVFLCCSLLAGAACSSRQLWHLPAVSGWKQGAAHTLWFSLPHPQRGAVPARAFIPGRPTAPAAVWRRRQAGTLVSFQFYPWPHI